MSGHLISRRTLLQATAAGAGVLALGQFGAAQSATAATTFYKGADISWVPQMESLKRHGVIDSYSVMVRLNQGAGDNVLLLLHYPTLANLDPDKTRDMALLAEGRAQMSKEAGEKLTNGFDRYRSFSSDEIWTGIDYPKAR